MPKKKAHTSGDPMCTYQRKWFQCRTNGYFTLSDSGRARKAEVELGFAFEQLSSRLKDWQKLEFK